MEQNETARNAIIKNPLVEELEKINEKINGLGEYYATSANLLLELCDTFESLFDALIAVNEQNHTALAYEYEGVRKDCEYATKTPDKKESYSKEYYNRGKRQLTQLVQRFIIRLKAEK